MARGRPRKRLVTGVPRHPEYYLKEPEGGTSSYPAPSGYEASMEVDYVYSESEEEHRPRVKKRRAGRRSLSPVVPPKPTIAIKLESPVTAVGDHALVVSSVPAKKSLRQSPKKAANGSPAKVAFLSASSLEADGTDSSPSLPSDMETTPRQAGYPFIRNEPTDPSERSASGTNLLQQHSPLLEFQMTTHAPRYACYRV